MYKLQGPLRLLACIHLLKLVHGAGIDLSNAVYNYLGPWPIGKAEFDADPAEAYGGIALLASKMDRDARFVSELAPNGHIGWRQLRAQGGAVTVAPADIAWNGLVQSLSAMEVLEHQGWAVTAFSIPRPARYRFACRGVVAYYVAPEDATSFADMQLLAGDIYGTGRVASFVRLAAGTHRLFVWVRAKAQATFQCSAALQQGSGSATGSGSSRLQARANLRSVCVTGSIMVALCRPLRR
jgi:hypothetical protein